MNCNINSSGLSDINSYNLITTNATVLSSLNVAGNIIGSGTALSNLSYGSIINPPDLTQYNAWTKSGLDIYNTSLSGKVGIGITNPTGLFEIKNSCLTPGCDGFFRFLTAEATTNDIAFFFVMLIIMMIL
jgi:hypothetical protein